MEKGVSFSQAIEGYLLYAHSRRLSEYTIADYSSTFGKLARFLVEDVALGEITVERVEAFLGGQGHLSKKTILNQHTGLSALWTWAVKRRVVERHILREVDRPRPEQRVIETFTEEDVQRLLNACKRSEAYRRPGKKRCSNARPTAVRDRTIILVLLDSMVRVSELCGMETQLADLKAGTIKVLGKRGKERIVPISAETAEAVWYYLSVRGKPRPKYAGVLFLTTEGRRMERNAVGKLIRTLGRRVGVQANPHKFRHTGATQFVKNGGNVFALKRILGHATMTMVNRYVHMAQVDIEEAHRGASPVYNWDLR